MTTPFSDITIAPSISPTIPEILPLNLSDVDPLVPFDSGTSVIPPADPLRLFNANRVVVPASVLTDEPTVQLTAPYIPPAHVVAATSVGDMLDVRVPFDMNWTYEVGTPPINYKLGILVGNKCIENELRVVMSYPAYLTPDSPFPFVIPPLTVYNIGFSLNEAEAINRVPSGTRLFAEEFTVTTTVLNVTGPVYVKPQL